MLGTRNYYIYLMALAQLSSWKLIWMIENLVEFQSVYRWVGECRRNVFCTASDSFGFKMYVDTSLVLWLQQTFYIPKNIFKRKK